MQITFCKLPLPRLPHIDFSARNQDYFHNLLLQQPKDPFNHFQASNVRFMKRPWDKDHNRFALSGKLSDVCAALDAMAESEALATPSYFFVLDEVAPQKWNS